MRKVTVLIFVQFRSGKWFKESVALKGKTREQRLDEENAVKYKDSSTQREKDLE